MTGFEMRIEKNKEKNKEKKVGISLTDPPQRFRLRVPGIGYSLERSESVDREHS
jgi:hypothetical protein